MIPKYYFLKEDSSLKNFSDEIIDEITLKYSSKETISSFIKDYEGLKATTIYKDIPYKLTDLKCEYCDELMYHKIEGKNGSSPAKWLCSSCQHTKTNKCNCDTCLSKEKELLIFRKNEFSECWDDYYLKNFSFQYQINDLTIFDQIYLKMIIDEFSSSDQKCLTSDNLSYLYGANSRISSYSINNDLVQKAVEFIKRKILIPVKKQSYEINQFNSFIQIIESFDFLNIDWIINIKSPYDNENTIIENLTIYFNLKIYSELERHVLFKDIYDSLLKKYVQYLSSLHLKLIIDEISIDYILDDLYENLSLSKAFSIVYYSISSTGKNMKKYNYSDLNKINTHFRNRVLESVELYNKQELIIKDFNLPSGFSLSVFQNYVIDSIFHHKDSYFYLKSTRIL